MKGSPDSLLVVSVVVIVAVVVDVVDVGDGVGRGTSGGGWGDEGSGI